MTDTRTTRVLNRFARCRDKDHTDDFDLGPSASAGEGLASVTVATPHGPEAAAEAFAWLNRQVSWQSMLADLEGVRSHRRS